MWQPYIKSRHAPILLIIWEESYFIYSLEDMLAYFTFILLPGPSSPWILNPIFVRQPYTLRVENLVVCCVFNKRTPTRNVMCHKNGLMLYYRQYQQFSSHSVLTSGVGQLTQSHPTLNERYWECFSEVWTSIYPTPLPASHIRHCQTDDRFDCVLNNSK